MLQCVAARLGRARGRPKIACCQTGHDGLAMTGRIWLSFLTEDPAVSNCRSCGMELPSLWNFVTPPEMPYMSSRALKGLRDYKYVAGGYTWLDRVHTPFWNKTVEYFPLWLAPNLITLIGTGWLVLGYLVSSTYLTDFKGPPPPPPHPPSLLTPTPACRSIGASTKSVAAGAHPELVCHVPLCFVLPRRHRNIPPLLSACKQATARR